MTIFGEDKFAALARLAVVVLLSDCAFKVYCTIVMYGCSYRGRDLSPLPRFSGAGDWAWSCIVNVVFVLGCDSLPTLPWVRNLILWYSLNDWKPFCAVWIDRVDLGFLSPESRLNSAS